MKKNSREEAAAEILSGFISAGVPPELVPVYVKAAAEALECLQGSEHTVDDVISRGEFPSQLVKEAGPLSFVLGGLSSLGGWAAASAGDTVKGVTRALGGALPYVAGAGIVAPAFLAHTLGGHLGDAESNASNTATAVKNEELATAYDRGRRQLERVLEQRRLKYEREQKREAELAARYA